MSTGFDVAQGRRSLGNKGCNASVVSDMDADWSAMSEKVHDWLPPPSVNVKTFPIGLKLHPYTHVLVPFHKGGAY